MTTMKLDLEPLPSRLLKLPIDARGYPVPWFVAWVPGPDGVDVPEFRAMDAQKFVRAVKEKRCWVCGDVLGKWLTFPIGPMCAITRTISEPPSHQECAEWSVRNCPFLSTPNMTRRDRHLPEEHHDLAGVSILRNPGVALVWVTRDWYIYPDPNGQPLFNIGKPEATMWYSHGRDATRDEVMASIESGLPILQEAAATDGDQAVKELEAMTKRALELLPA